MKHILESLQKVKRKHNTSGLHFLIGYFEKLVEFANEPDSDDEKVYTASEVLQLLELVALDPGEIKANYGAGKAYVGKPIAGEFRGLILDRLTDRIIKTKKCIDWDSARLEADAAIKRIDKRAHLPEDSGRFEFHGVEGREVEVFI